MLKVSTAVLAVGAVASALLLPADASSVVSTQSAVNVIYRDVGRDPRNPLSDNPLTPWADVLKTARVLVRLDAGKALRVKVIARRDFPIPRRIPSRGLYQLYVSLDARGGPGEDYYFEFTNGRHGKCEFNAPIDARVGLCRTRETRSGALVMSGRTKYAHITKRIRWRVFTFPGYVDTFDVAPNHGWYS